MSALSGLAAFARIERAVAHMSKGDFLCGNASTPLRRHYSVAGAVCCLSTNSELLHEAARESFLPIDSSRASAEFSVRFWIDNSNGTALPLTKPYVRGLDHLVFAGFDARSSLLADLRSRRVIGRFSGETAADRAFWKTVVFPILLTILSGSLGAVELHCSCVAQRENGLLLVGPGRAGKSTLAAALGQAGFGFVSDDRTFCSSQGGKLSAWGMPAVLKLRSDAGTFFKQLRSKKPMLLPSGESGFRLDPETELGITRTAHCEPRMLVFLERICGSRFRVVNVSSNEAAARLEEDLLVELPETAARQMEVLGKLAQLPCRLLQYGGEPAEVAGELASHFQQL